MLSTAGKIPHELRELPGLNQDSVFLQLILADLNNHVMVEAERNLEEAPGTVKSKLTTYVPESELKQAWLMFAQKYVEMRVKEAALIEKRPP